MLVGFALTRVRTSGSAHLESVREWPRVTGRVLAADVVGVNRMSFRLGGAPPHAASIQYEYVVHETTYVDDRHASRDARLTERRAREIVDAHPPGRLVPVAHHPLQPWESILATDHHAPSMPASILGYMIGVTGFMMLLGLLKGFRT